MGGGGGGILMITDTRKLGVLDLTDEENFHSEEIFVYEFLFQIPSYRIKCRDTIKFYIHEKIEITAEFLSNS